MANSSSKAHKPNAVLGEVYDRRKPLQCIDIFHMENGDAKCTFVRNVPLSRDEEGNVTKWDKKSFYEFISGIPRGTHPSEIHYRELAVVEKIA